MRPTASPIISSVPGLRGVSGWQAAAMALVALTSLQAATLKPYLVLVSGSRANLFTTLLCALCLLAAVAGAAGMRPRPRPLEWLGTAALLLLALASGLASAEPLESTLRSAAVMLPAAGGFWCGRVLVTGRARAEGLAWLCCLALGLMLVFSLVSWLRFGQVWRLLDANPHPYAARLIALSFGPLALALIGAGRRRLAAWASLAVTFLTLFATSLRSAVVAPAVMTLLGLGWVRAARRWLLVGLLAAVAVAAVFFAVFPDKRAELTPTSPPVYYRLESYAFAWHVTMAHPWLGVGLRAPRGHLLADYQMRLAPVSKQKFADYLDLVVTHENVVLTFMAGLGLPFTLLYLALLALALAAGLRPRPADPPGRRALRLALALPLAGLLYHFMVFDGLLHPQVGWFFHLLVGTGVGLGQSTHNATGATIL